MTGRTAIQTLFQRGRRVERATLLVLWLPAEGRPQAAFAVSRQVRGAVRRNRARRRVREAYRVVRPAAPDGVALVVIAKRPALDAPFETVKHELREALEAIRR